MIKRKVGTNRKQEETNWLAMEKKTKQEQGQERTVQDQAVLETVQA